MSVSLSEEVRAGGITAGQEEYTYPSSIKANFIPRWSVTDFLFENLVVSSYSILAIIEIGEATCKEFRLPISELEVELVNNKEKNICQLTVEIERASVRKPDN